MTRLKLPDYSLLMPLLFIAAILITGAALGNVIIPSFVDMICAPLPEIIGTIGLAAIVGVPSLVLVSLLEAVVVKRLSRAERLRRIFLWLLLGNTLSSIVGLFAEIRLQNSIWPNPLGFVLAWLLSSLAESPFVKWALKPLSCRFSSALRFSLIANAASYAALLAVVLALTALPLYSPSRLGLRKELRGALFVYHNHHRLSVFSRLPSSRLDVITTDDDPYTRGFCGSATGGMFLLDQHSLAWELIRAGDRWSVTSSPTRLPGVLLCVGGDGKTLVCGTTNRVIVVGGAGVQRNIWIRQESVVIPVRAALSYDGRYLAYTVQDLSWLERDYRDAFGRKFRTLAEAPPQFWQDYGDLILHDIDTDASSTVTRIHGNHFGFHPRSNLLAFVSYDAESQEDLIEVLDIRSQKRHTVARETFLQTASNIAWSPDGKFLAWMQWHAPNPFISRGYDGSLWIAATDGQGRAPMPIVFPRTVLGTWVLVWRSE